MPGLIGYTHIPDDSDQKPLARMRDIITHEPFYIQDPLFWDRHVGASRAHINVIQKKAQPYITDGIYVWLDGEFFNQNELGAGDDDAAVLATLYRRDPLMRFLEKIDGIYSAIIYDEKAKKIILVTDRYGLRHLYWSLQQECLIWGSELKAFLVAPNFQIAIDKHAVTEFIQIGYLLENRTWFENVQLVPSGSALIWDIENKTHKMMRYWWWDRIKPISGALDKESVAEELGRLFIESVNRRCRSNENIGLTLSGGLDSRAVLAAIPEYFKNINVFTFGKKNSLDVRIAQKVSKLRHAKHHVFEIDQSNWLKDRIHGVWWTDGMFDLKHMHGLRTDNFIRHLFEINMNGFAGDLVLGGSYLKSKYDIDTPINPDIAARTMHCSSELIRNTESYRNLGKIDYYFLQNRVRRGTIGGSRTLLVSIEYRMPFMDNKLLEFAYSLPDSLRFDHYIYNKALLKKFPKYYKNIPWQKTCAPIGYSNFVARITRTPGRILKEISKLKLISYSDNRAFIDYDNWLRQEPARSFFHKMLLNDDALYLNFTSKEPVVIAMNRHFNGENQSELLCRYLTFELWLRQIFENKFRNKENFLNVEIK